MNSFDWSMYDEEAEPSKPSTSPKKPKQDSFDWDLYDDGVTEKISRDVPDEQPSEKGKQKEWGFIIPDTHVKRSNPFKTDVSSEDFEKMNLVEKLEYGNQLEKEQRYRSSKAFTKGVASGLSFGGSEFVPGLEPEEDDDPVAGFAGNVIGETPYLLASFAAIEKSLKAIPTAYKWGKRLLRGTEVAAVGGGFETARQAVKGEGFDKEKIATHAATFVLFDSAVRAIPHAWDWLKKLSPTQQAEVMFEGVAPQNLSEQQYKFYQDKFVPELKAIAEKEYQEGLQKATQEVDLAFQQEMANVEANHTNNVYQSEKEYQQKLHQVTAQHQANQQALEEANARATQEYQQKQAEWDQTVKRQDAVKSALETVTPESGKDLKGRIQPQGEDVGVRPPESQPKAPPLKERVGSVISKDKITNTYDAGQKQIKAVRASDEVDYKAVQDKYKINDELNSQVETTQSNLGNELRLIVEDINSIPDPSAPQNKIKQTADKVLNSMIEFDEAGNAIGWKPVNNKVLLDQAKALRYSMDFDFAHGNPTGILQPLVNLLEEAAQNGAVSVGNEAAVAANKAAKQAYREWADLYRNDLIKSYRDVGNFKYQKTFDDSLNVDNFIQLDKVLSRSNAGQQLSAQTRRELINKELNPFFKNPKESLTEKFTEVLDELEPVLKPGERQKIINQFNEAKKTPVVTGKKVDLITKPKEPKLKSIKEFEPPKRKKEVSKVNIPRKPEVKPSAEMKEIAKRMEISPEEVIKKTSTPSGWKELKKWSSKSEAGQQLFREAGKKKMKELIYQGNVRHKLNGDDWHKILNKSENFDIFSEIIGEEATIDLLNSAEKIGKEQVTLDRWKKAVKKVATLKAANIFGLLD
jgi:hypothetical protein